MKVLRTIKYNYILLVCFILLNIIIFKNDLYSNNDGLSGVKYLSTQDSINALPATNQLNAYNTRNIDAYIENFSDSIKVYRMKEQEPFCVGIKQFREIYSNLFQSKTNLFCRVINRTVCGDFVIDEELVDGLLDGEQVHAVAIYEIRNGLIQNIWFIKE